MAMIVMLFQMFWFCATVVVCCATYPHLRCGVTHYCVSLRNSGGSGRDCVVPSELDDETLVQIVRRCSWHLAESLIQVRGQLRPTDPGIAHSTFFGMRCNVLDADPPADVASVLAQYGSVGVEKTTRCLLREVSLACHCACLRPRVFTLAGTSLNCRRR